MEIKRLTMRVSREDYINYLKEFSGKYTGIIINIVYFKLINNEYSEDYKIGINTLSNNLMFIYKLRCLDDSTLFIDEYNKYLTHPIIDDDKSIGNYLQSFSDAIDYTLFDDVRRMYKCITNYIANIFYFKIDIYASILNYVIDFIIDNKGNLELPKFIEGYDDLTYDPDNWNFYILQEEHDLPVLEKFDVDNSILDDCMKGD